MIYRLHPDYPEVFPNPEDAEADGLLAVGGDLSVRRLVAAYQSGVFPWYSEGQPLLWWSPDPRCVITLEQFRLPHTVRRELRKCPFVVTHDRAFRAVLEGCSSVHRPDQDGTWLVPDMIAAYTRLHEAGFAHSVEVWDTSENGATADLTHLGVASVFTEAPTLTVGTATARLVGGLYGVRLGGVFFGESMFHIRPNASKRALVALMERMRETGGHLVDCQMTTKHIMRYGAECIPRRRFLQLVHELVSA